MVDKQCYGGSSHGMVRQHTLNLIPQRSNLLQTWYWHRASDPGSRSRSVYPQGSEIFDVKAEQPADLVIIQMGGNDWRAPNEIPGKNFYSAYIELIEDIHNTWPHAVVLVMVCNSMRVNYR